MNDPSGLIQGIILLVLILLSAFFSGSETALTAVNNTLGKIRMQRMTDRGDRRAARVLRILDDSGRMISTILLCNNVCNVSLTALATSLSIHLFGDASVGITTAILTVALLIFGEITPKEMAMAKADRFALAASGPILFLMLSLRPLVYIVTGLSKLLARILNVTGDEKRISNDEFVSIIREVRRDGVLDYDEMKLIYNVLGFDESVATDIMTPTADIRSLPAEANHEEALEFLKDVSFTRIPVYEDEDPEKICGFVSVRDIALAGGREGFCVRDILQPGYYTHEHKKVAVLLDEMQKNKHKVCFVVDEYGSTVGMITLFDLVEEITGDILNDDITQLDELTYRAQGSAKLDDVNDLLHTQFDSEDYDSIGGFFIEMSGDAIPRDKQSVTLDNGIRLEIRGVRQNRIMSVVITLPEPAPEDPVDIPLPELPADEPIVASEPLPEEESTEDPASPEAFV